ncbi:MAG: chemotaxis-specific protein-glutamate methyltransferase CheB [Altererythrobacter sp.]|nr:chemotaxis-specific protein-glutamate methyltransferase CheB [Altererythrobacter sp.]
MGAAPGFAVRGPARRRAADRVRVVIVDDSPTVRAVFARIIEGEADLELAAAQDSAEAALARLVRWAPDVILLDLDMPGMGGLDAIPRMIELAAPVRVLVVSSLAVRGAEHTLKALSLGAADTLAKPRPGEFDDAYRATLLRKVRLLGRGAKHARLKAAAPPPPPLRAHGREAPRVLAVGASTGGIHALGQLFRALPREVDLPILVTQHLPASFMEPFVRQLQAAADRPASVAVEGMPIRPRQIVVAPGDAHLTVIAGPGGKPMAHLRGDPVPSGCRPSVDPMFESCARLFGGRAMGIVLSGMGRDGAIGAERIAAAGGTVMAQDAASSAVWGMPGAVAGAGLASAVLPPDQLALRVAAAVDAR